MKKRTNSPADRFDDDMPYGTLRRIEDTLPPPDELLPPDKSMKITLVLDEGTVTFFKRAAKKSGQKYQRLIRAVLKGYADTYS